jgi:nicotinamidase-related amidase
VTSLSFDPRTAALVLIDLQNGIMGRTLAPHASSDVIARGARLAEAVYVRVDIGDILHLPADAPSRDPNAPAPPASASELVPDCGYQAGDVAITKRSWGAFYGTGLEQQLRRRGIRTILLGGVATNFGVESTAREAFDRGYELIFVEDAMSSMAAEIHTFAVQTIFPRMGRVRTLEQVLGALGQ